MKHKMHYIFLIYLLFLVSCTAKKHQPPIAKVIPTETEYHGLKFTDDYSWMKDKTRQNKEVLTYIEEENLYTKNKMKSTEQLQNNIFNEIIDRMEEENESLPIKRGNYYYFWKRDKGQQYSDYFRKKGTLEAKAELLLGMNELAEQHSYISVSNVSVSPNHRYLAYLVDFTGTEEYTLQIKDLETNQFLPETKQSVGGITWANDNKTIFFSVEDISGRTYRIYRHQLGNNVANAELVFQEDDGKFYAWTYRSRSNQYIFLGTSSKTTSEIWFLHADKPEEPFQIIEPRKTGVEYYVSHAKDTFYITTNADNAFNYQVMKTSCKTPQRTHWQTFIPHRDSVTVSVDVFQNKIAVFERINGRNQLRITDHELKNNQIITFPETTYSLYHQTNPEYEIETYRFAYESYITPYTVYELNLQDFSLEIAKEQIVRGNFDKNDYETELLYAHANDGTAIPVSLAYKKTLPVNSPAPLLLHAYGSYGDASDPYFSVSRLSLLDRGIIFATAHVRGGGELGKKWYDNGKLLKKKNTFTDFIDCAEFLITNNYTNSDQLIIQGGSAGGLLIGAVLNMRPELFHAAIADVPFVDVLNTMFDPTLSAVESEYEEWGNPNDKVYFDYIRSYCPYQNVSSQNYPHLLILAGFNDPRVSYWEPLKWTAKLRANKLDSNLLLLKMNMNSGHGGASGREDYLREIAFEYAFILNVLGIKN